MKLLSLFGRHGKSGASDATGRGQRSLTFVALDGLQTIYFFRLSQINLKG